MVVSLGVDQELLPLIVGSLLMLLASVVLLILCVCGKRPETKDPSESYRKTEKTQAESVVLTVDNSVVPLANDQPQNGTLRNSGGSSSGGGSSPHPPGAGQRELPQPPSNGISRNRNTIAGSHASASRNGNTNNRNTVAGLPTEGDEDDDYDHLVRSIKSSRKSNYDHVTIGEDGVPKLEIRKEDSVPAAVGGEMPENDYAEVQKENIYEGVKDGKPNEEPEDDYSKVKDEIPRHLKKVYDPYAMVSDEGSDGTFRDVDPYTSVKDPAKSDDLKNGAKEFDPYSKVKDDPYSKLPDDVDDPYNKVEDPYNKVKDDDPYNKVKGDDPYNKVKGDDPYSKVKGDDPYNKVKGDDPYNRVKDDEDDLDDDPYNKVKDEEESGGSWSPKDATSYQYSKVDINRKNKNGDQSVEPTTNVLNSGDFSVQSYAGEYAQVVKNRNRDGAPTPPPLNNRQTEIDPYALPPEPPRRYNDPVVGVSSASVTVRVGHPSDLANQRPPDVSQASGDVTQTLPSSETSAATPGVKKEPPYHKLTARESMASINARRAMNMYEEVRDTENMYATVEGGSGDGVVKAVESKTTVPLDDYAEIGATGGRNTIVPAPPSLDSLHMMTKTDGKHRLSAELDHHPDTAHRSPGAESNSRLSANIDQFHDGSSSIGMINPAFDDREVDGGDIMLDPNYTTVRDCIPDSEGDVDPNYESVEEAKAKTSYQSAREKEREMIMERKKKAHVYEVVKTSEAEEVKERVLRSHMYEDLDGVKFEKEKLESCGEKAQSCEQADTCAEVDDSSKRNSEIWKRRSDIEDEKL